MAASYCTATREHDGSGHYICGTTLTASDRYIRGTKRWWVEMNGGASLHGDVEIHGGVSLHGDAETTTASDH